MATTNQDLPFDVTVNGVTYSKGENVEINKDHVEAVNDIVADHQGALDYQSTHHGAVPAPNDPQEVSAGTPTRPLGADNVVQPVSVQPATVTGDVVRVADPNEGKEAATDASAKVENNGTEPQA